MALLSNRISPVKCLSADVEGDQVYNALNSLALLNIQAQLPSLSPWVTHTYASLTPERCEQNRLIFEGLGYALTPSQNYPDFPSYLDALASTDPVLLRDYALLHLSSALPGPLEYGCTTLPVEPASLLRDPQSYLAHVRLVNPTLPLDPSIQQRTYSLLQTPEILQSTLVSHLRLMWKALLAPEWKRIQRSLQAQVTIYKECLDSSLSAQELFRLFTGRDLLSLFPLRTTSIERIILIPSPHNGRYVTQWLSSGTLRLFFTAPANFGLALRPTTMNPQELRLRLKSLADALADETRLRILELFIEYDQLIAQDLIERLNLSQSSVSRHLKQLVHSGYLLEKREGATKLYSFNALNFDSTIRALELLKLGAAGSAEPASPLLETLPHSLKRFVDLQGRVTLWPLPRQKDQQLVLEYLATKFDAEQAYNADEASELLAHYSLSLDSSSLLQDLLSSHLLSQAPDGSLYRPLSRPV